MEEEEDNLFYLKVGEKYYVDIYHALADSANEATQFIFIKTLSQRLHVYKIKNGAKYLVFSNVILDENNHILIHVATKSRMLCFDVHHCALTYSCDEDTSPVYVECVKSCKPLLK
jgi:uncharacterized membrane protein YvbJ